MSNRREGIPDDWPDDPVSAEDFGLLLVAMAQIRADLGGWPDDPGAVAAYEDALGRRIIAWLTGQDAPEHRERAGRIMQHLSFVGIGVIFDELGLAALPVDEAAERIMAALDKENPIDASDPPREEPDEAREG